MILKTSRLFKKTLQTYSLMSETHHHASEHFQRYEDLPTPPHSDDEDNDDLQCIMMQSCVCDISLCGNNEKMITCTNFSIRACNLLWDDIKEKWKSSFISGGIFGGCLFITLSVLKHRTTCEWYAIGFGYEKSIFKRMIERMLVAFHSILKDKYLYHVGEEYCTSDIRKMEAFVKAAKNVLGKFKFWCCPHI